MGQPYTKPHLPIADQLALLKQRGLSITDDAKATDALQRIGYYRLSGYWHPMREIALPHAGGTPTVLDQFKQDSTCAHVVDLYVFDKKLRMLLLDAIERVEVGLRVEMALLLSKRDPWAHRKAQEVHYTFAGDPGDKGHVAWVQRQDKEEARSREEFVAHFFGKYTSALPIWMAIELWDFGMLTTLLSGMKVADQSALASHFGLPRPSVLTSWVQSINHVRNICAHHNRLWNRAVKLRPVMPRLGEMPGLNHLAQDTYAQSRLYGVAVLLRHFLKTINPTTTWPARLAEHFTTFPASPHYSIRDTGFPLDWEQLPFWA